MGDEKSQEGVGDEEVEGARIRPKKPIVHVEEVDMVGGEESGRRVKRPFQARKDVGVERVAGGGRVGEVWVVKGMLEAVSGDKSDHGGVVHFHAIGGEVEGDVFLGGEGRESLFEAEIRSDPTADPEGVEVMFFEALEGLRDKNIDDGFAERRAEVGAGAFGIDALFF